MAVVTLDGNIAVAVYRNTGLFILIAVKMIAKVELALAGHDNILILFNRGIGVHNGVNNFLIFGIVFIFDPNDGAGALLDDDGIVAIHADVFLALDLFLLADLNSRDGEHVDQAHHQYHSHCKEFFHVSFHNFVLLSNRKDKSSAAAPA